MAVTRYRDISVMPAPPRPRGERLLLCIAAVWERAHMRGNPDIPHDVAKYRSLLEAQTARDARTAHRLRALRAGLGMGVRE